MGHDILKSVVETEMCRTFLTKYVRRIATNALEITLKGYNEIVIINKLNAHAKLEIKR
jgi:hypothetical protein